MNDFFLVLSTSDNPITGGIVIILIGLGIFMLSLYRTIKGRKSIKKCTLEVNGKVTEIKPVRIAEEPTAYFTVCTYCVNGINYTAESKTGGKQIFSPCDDIIICCDPDNPQNFILPYESNTVTAYSIILYIVSAITVTAGILLLITGGNPIII